MSKEETDERLRSALQRAAEMGRRLQAMAVQAGVPVELADVVVSGMCAEASGMPGNPTNTDPVLPIAWAYLRLWARSHEARR